MPKTATAQTCDTCKLCNNDWCDIWNCAVDSLTGISCQHYEEESN